GGGVGGRPGSGGGAPGGRRSGPWGGWWRPLGGGRCSYGWWVWGGVALVLWAPPPRERRGWPWGVLCTPFAAGALFLQFGSGFAVVVATTAGAPGGGALFRGGGRVVALFDGLAGLGINPRQSLGQAQSLAHIAVELPCIALRFIMGLGDDGQLLPEFAQLAVELFQLVRT